MSVRIPFRFDVKIPPAAYVSIWPVIELLKLLSVSDFIGKLIGFSTHSDHHLYCSIEHNNGG